MSLSYNNFKSTTVRGIFKNEDDSSGGINADAYFKRNCNIGGNGTFDGDGTFGGDLYLGTETTIETETEEEEILTEYVNTGGNIIFNLNGVTHTLTPEILSYLQNIPSDILELLNLKVDKASPTFTGTVTMPTLTITDINFVSTAGRKLAFHSSHNDFNYYGLAIEGYLQRYNVSNAHANHVFSYGNATEFIEMARINSTGLAVTGNITFTGNINTITPTEFNYLDNVTSNIQTQLNSKYDKSYVDSTFGTITNLNLKADKSYVDSTFGTLTNLNLKSNTASPAFTGNVTFGGTLNTITTTEFGYLDNVTSNIQTQLNSKSNLENPIFTGTVTIPTLKFTDVVSRKIILWEMEGGSDYRYYGFATESSTLRYNSNSRHLFSHNNGTSFINIAEFNPSGLDVTGNITFTGNINTITPTEFNYLDNVTSNIQTQLNSKSDKSYVDSTFGTITNLDLKSNKSYVDSTFGTITNLNLKADKTYVDSTFLTTADLDLNIKADLTYVDETFATIEDLELKADKSYVDTLVTVENLESKADMDYVDSTFGTITNLNLKADKSYVDSTFGTITNLDLKSDKSYVDSTFGTITNLDLKSDKSYVDSTFGTITNLNLKADTSYVNTTFGTMTNLNLKANTASPTFTGTVTIPTLIFPSNASKKISLWGGTSAFLYYGLSVESGTLRYNVTQGTNHVFSYGNNLNTAFFEMARITATGLAVTGNITFTGNINTITSTEFNCLDNVTSNIQTQINSKSNKSYVDSTFGTITNLNLKSDKTYVDSTFATIASLGNKANIISPSFWGTVTMGDDVIINSGLNTYTPLLNCRSNLQAQIDSKPNIASPTFTGTVTIPNLNITNNLNVTNTIDNKTNGFLTGPAIDNGMIQSFTQGEVGHTTHVNASTIISNPFTTRTISMSTPISLHLTWSGNGIQYAHTVTSIGCELLKNGTKIMDIPFSFTRGLPFTNKFNASSPSSYTTYAQVYIGQGTANFILPSESGTNTYLVRYVFGRTLININTSTIWTNRTISGDVLYLCTRTDGSPFGGYLPYSYSESLIKTPVSSGTIETYNSIIRGDLKNNSVAGAYMVTNPASRTQTVPIYKSVLTYENFYSDDPGPIAVGSFITTSFNKIDYYYHVCPGYRLVVYDNFNYTGTVVLDYYNKTTKQQSVGYGSNGSSCKLYFHGELIV